MPGGARTALDVGCGEGVLARALRERIPDVTGVDQDEPSLELAREYAHDGIDYVLGDFTTYPFEPESFDVVTSVASLHHMDPERALARMAALVAPGGMLGVIGLARSRRLRDFAVDAGATVAVRYHLATKRYWDTPAPIVWPPPHTYAQMRELAESSLPDVRYRRRLLWRYTLVWHKPAR